MASSSLKNVVQGLRCLAAGELSDGELLQHFVGNADEAAFATLLRRHGRVVLGVCRRVLGAGPDAEDVFQATFVVLARKAGSICKQDSLPSWLHGVAYRMAARLRSQRGRRRKREQVAEGGMDIIAEDRSTAADPCARASLRELSAMLDQELQRLPKDCSDAVVLCLLGGLSNSQAARRLGWPVTTLKARFQRGRDLLRERLQRRGVSLSAVTLSAGLVDEVTVVPATLAKAALQCVSQKAVPAQVAALAAGAMGAGASGMVKLAAVAAFAVMLACISTAALLQPQLHQGAATPKSKDLNPRPQPSQVSQTTCDKKSPAATDLYGDPLPDGVLARLGTERFRHGSFTLSLAYALGGKVLVSGGGTSYSICIWDAETGKPLHKLSYPSSCRCFAVSPDGKTLFTDSFLRIDIATGKEKGQLKPMPKGLPDVALSPDGRTAAIANDGKNNLELWDIETGEQLRSLVGHKGYVFQPAFSPDGNTLATCGQDKTLRLWDVATGKDLRRTDINGGCGPCFAPNGKILATASSGLEGDVVRLWDVETGKQNHQLIGTQGCIQAIFSPDGKMLATTNRNYELQLWNPETGKIIRQWNVPASAQFLAFSPDGKVLASGGRGIQRWDVATGQELGIPANHTEGIHSLRFASDGKTLLSGTWCDALRLWDLSTCREQIQQRERPIGSGIENWKPGYFALSPDTLIVAACGNFIPDLKRDPTIYLFDTRTGKLLRSLLGHGELPRVMQFSSDGKFLNSAGTDGTHVWNVANGTEQNHLEKLRVANDGALAFSPDGRLVAIAGEDKKVGLFEIATGKEIRHWDRRDQRSRNLTFSGDGKWLTYVADSDISVWSTNTGKELARFTSPMNSSFHSLVFSPNGQVLAAVEQKIRTLPNGYHQRIYALRLWEPLTNQEIRTIELDLWAAGHLALKPDGRILACGGGDATILLWDLSGQAKDRKLEAAELGALWADLIGPAPQAYAAGWALALNPQVSMIFLKEKMKPAVPAPAEQTGQLLSDLESQQFATRDKATKMLEALGEAAEGAMRQALQGKVSLETHRRLETLLQKRDPDQLRMLRAIDVLERVGKPDARHLLETLSNNTPNPTVAEVAAFALARFAKSNFSP
jgi:RNA polymerase sigma factor (sigma-70 family)